MSRTKIFISSTYFDLSQIRENLKISLSDMGHDPVLSEYPSFPVLPDLNTVNNCKRNVKENCNVFVLIIGGRKGSLDPQTNKTITNIEYETAVQNNKDSFIFVNKKVWDLLEIWKKNANADFTPTVDNPSVFEFINKIKSTQKWIFNFDQASDIIEILKNQLSVFLAYLIQRKNSGKLDPIKEFLNESILAQELVLDKPDNWEHLLTAELIKIRFNDISEKLEDLDKGYIYKKTKEVEFPEYLRELSPKLNDTITLIQAIGNILNKEFTKAWGPLGEQGNEFEIKKTVEKLYNILFSFVEWEAELRALNPPDHYNHIKELTFGIAKYVFDKIKNFAEELEIPIREGKTGLIKITFDFDTIPNIDKLQKELEKLSF